MYTALRHQKQVHCSKTSIYKTYTALQSWVTTRTRQRNRGLGTRKQSKNILVSVSTWRNHTKYSNIAITNNFEAWKEVHVGAAVLSRAQLGCKMPVCTKCATLKVVDTIPRDAASQEDDPPNYGPYSPGGGGFPLYAGRYYKARVFTACVKQWRLRNTVGRQCCRVQKTIQPWHITLQ